METWTVGIGRTITRKVTLRYAKDTADASKRGKPITGVYTGAETLSLSLWTGDAIAPIGLSGSLASWLSATDGTFTVKLDDTDTADLVAGVYRLEVTLTTGDEPYTCFEALVRVRATAGAGVALATYCTFDEVVTFAPWIADLITQNPSIQSDLGEQRGAARRWLNRQLLSRARRDLMEQLERHAPVSAATPYTFTQFVDGGPAWGVSTYSDTTLESELALISASLDSDYVADTDPGLVDSNREAAEICAHYTAYLVGRSEIGGEGRTNYQRFAFASHARARFGLAGYVAKIYTDDSDAPYRMLKP